MEINTPKISEILKIEISFFKLSYLSQFKSDLNKFGLKSRLRYFLLKAKKLLKIQQKALFCDQSNVLPFLGHLVIN